MVQGLFGWNDPHVVYAHLDEKLFEAVPQKYQYVLRESRNGRQVQPVALKNARQQDRVMFLGVVGRPVGDFDGRICMIPIGKYQLTRNSSAHRPAGSKVFKSETLRAENFERIMKEDVFPSIQAAVGAFARKVYVQIDNAPPHGGNELIDRLNALGLTLNPVIEIYRQSARSPEMNTLDGGIWTSLARGVEAVKDPTLPTDMVNVSIIEHVKARWNCWPDAALKIYAAFDTCLKVAYLVLQHEGRNQFRTPHRTREERQSLWSGFQARMSPRMLSTLREYAGRVRDHSLIGKLRDRPGADLLMVALEDASERMQALASEFTEMSVTPDEEQDEDEIEVDPE